MKRAVFAALLLFPVWPARVSQALPDQKPASRSSAALECTLRVHATGFRSRKGLAEAAIFVSPDGWPEQKDKAVASGGVPITGTEATLMFKLPPGRYGVVVLADTNKNEKLDRNFLGVPSEGFGFANNPRVFLIAPSFQQATVPVTCPVTRIDVKMIYK